MFLTKEESHETRGRSLSRFEHSTASCTHNVAQSARGSNKTGFARNPRGQQPLVGACLFTISADGSVAFDLDLPKRAGYLGVDNLRR